jgi:GNAT superfamily N-acetyltransferase
MGRPYILRQATSAESAVIQELGDQARHWLAGKNTDQWSTQWGGRWGRDRRIMRDVDAGHAWIVWDDGVGVATISVDVDVPLAAPDMPVWPAWQLTEKALYVHRVIVRRSHAGIGLGAALLDWASGFAVREIGTPLLRIDVWTDNLALHDYYLGQGFTLCEIRDEAELPGYPSRALFERRTSPPDASPLFIEQ